MVKRISTFLLTLCLFASLVLPVFAAPDGVEIVGNYSDKFELTGSGGSLFSIPIMNPGDVWGNKVNITNNAGNKMEVQLSEVVNDIEDSMIFDVLQVTIYINDEVFYEGPYNKIPKSEWIVIENGKTLEFDVVLKFPGECGNEYQGKEFDSTWKFESRLPEGVKPNEDNEDVQTGVDSKFILYVGLAAFTGTCLALLILPGKRNKKEDDKEKEEQKK